MFFTHHNLMKFVFPAVMRELIGFGMLLFGKHLSRRIRRLRVNGYIFQNRIIGKSVNHVSSIVYFVRGFMRHKPHERNVSINRQATIHLYQLNQWIVKIEYIASSGINIHTRHSCSSIYRLCSRVIRTLSK